MLNVVDIFDPLLLTYDKHGALPEDVVVRYDGLAVVQYRFSDHDELVALRLTCQ